MTFEEWFEKWWGDRTDGPYKSINVESIARAAWEAAQAQAKGAPSDTQQKIDKLTEHVASLEAEVALLNSVVSVQPALRDQFAMAALPECASEHRYKNDNGETVAKEAYMFADAMLKEREK